MKCKAICVGGIRKGKRCKYDAVIGDYCIMHMESKENGRDGFRNNSRYKKIKRINYKDID